METLLVSKMNYTQAGQIAGRSRDSDAYAWTNNYNVERSYTTNPPFDSLHPLRLCPTHEVARLPQPRMSSGRGGRPSTLGLENNRATHVVEAPFPVAFLA